MTRVLTWAFGTAIRIVRHFWICIALRAIPFYRIKAGPIAFFSAGSAGTVAPPCRHTLQSIHCGFTGAIFCTFQVLHKCSVILSLRCIYLLFCHSSQCLSTSAVLRESIARLLLCFVVSTLSCCISLFSVITSAFPFASPSIPTFSRSVPSLLHRSVPIIFLLSDCLFTKPFGQQLSNSPTFPSSVSPSLKFFISYSSLSFAHTFRQLSDASFYLASPLRTLILPLTHPFHSPLFRHAVPAFIRRPVPTSLQLSVFVLLYSFVPPFISCSVPFKIRL